METTLKTFAQRLKPTEGEERAGRVLNKVLEILKSSSTYKIDRTVISGSFGKSVSLEGFDVDVVAFVNGENPPFGGVIQNWAGILRKYYTNIKTTKHSIQFHLDGIDFDLLPAPNHTLGRQFYSAESRINFQADAVRSKIREYFQRNRKYNSMFSSGLAESQVEFMKKQGAHVHEVVRLAKYWFKTTPMEKFPGCSLIIELIATHCANRAQYSILEGFRGFLGIMTDLGKAYIVFPGSNIDSSIQAQRPMITDPSNPYNNLGRKFMTPSKQKHWKRINDFKRYAAVTLGRLSGGNASLELIFKAQ